MRKKTLLTQVSLLVPLILAAVIYPYSSSLALPTPDAGRVEVLQAEATLLYHSKDYDGASKTLFKVLTIDPVNIGALEMLALARRQLNQDKGALDCYYRLLKYGPKDKKAAYSFEIGMLQFKRKKYTEAHKHFETAALGNFNPGTSNFFLGIINFNAKSWRKARNHFSAALTENDAKPMQPVTRYYLANSYAQMGKSEYAIRYYNSVSGIQKEETPNSADVINSMTGDIRKNALKELKSLDQGSHYLSLTLLSQWDSNVQTNPSEVNNPVAASSQRSLKGVVSIAAGLSTSPSETFQISPSYRFFTNYNFNELARDFNFMSHTPSLYVLYKPSGRFTTGAKAEGTLSLKNNLAAEDSRSDLKYKLFSLSGDIGPLAKYELTPKIALAAEVTWRPKKFYLDPLTGDSRRSGGGIFSRLSGEFISSYWWWNPLIYFTYEWDHPSGRNFRSKGWGIGASNPVPITNKFTLTGSFDLLSTDYYDQPTPKRDDVLATFRALASYSINSHWSAMADASFITNQSSISTSYKYDRITISAGATYNF